MAIHRHTLRAVDSLGPAHHPMLVRDRLQRNPLESFPHLPRQAIPPAGPNPPGGRQVERVQNRGRNLVFLVELAEPAAIVAEQTVLGAYPDVSRGILQDSPDGEIRQVKPLSWDHFAST